LSDAAILNVHSIKP